MGKMMTLIGTLIVIGIIGGSGYIAFSIFIKTGSNNEMRVRYGDTVHVNYIGRFETGKIFDTSLWNVAKDDKNFTKALSFALRAQSDYTPFNFTVGKGTVIKGWDTGVIDMFVGQTRPLTIPKENAYGDSNPSLIKTLPLVQRVPMTNEMNLTNFRLKFSVSPEINLEVSDPYWGWTETVVSIVGDAVTTSASPGVGDVVHPYKAWSSKVISVDSSVDGGKGMIEVEHEITSDMVNNVMEKDSSGGEFFLTGLSTFHGTFTIDFNREVVGKTLVFTVTLEKIIRT